MKKGRSRYEFKLNCNVDDIQKVITDFINANQFKEVEKDGEKYYKAGDAMIGYKYFKYELSDNNLIIYAWLKNFNTDVSIDQEGLTGVNVNVMNYKNLINSLFKEIEKINITTNNSNNEVSNRKIVRYDANTGKPIYEDELNSNNQSFSEVKTDFEKDVNKKQETMCEIGFWLSLGGLLCSFIGLTYGVIIYIMDFYFASQGLKTRKKGKAIATIVLSIISILIIIVQIALVSN